MGSNMTDRYNPATKAVSEVLRIHTQALVWYLRGSPGAKIAPDYGTSPNHRLKGAFPNPKCGACRLDDEDMILGIVHSAHPNCYARMGATAC